MILKKENHQTGNPAQEGRAAELSAGKRFAFYFVGLVMLPVAFFALVEVSLRIVNYGGFPPLFQPVPDYEEFLQPADDVAHRYFSPGAVIPGIPFDSFRKEREPNSLRIFVQGGSTAAGYPYYFGGGFTDMLEQRLMQTFPGRTVEVVGTAMAAVNSYTLLDLADEIISQEPDAVIIYAGHNEYYGALGVGSIETLGKNPALVRAYLSLQRFRTVQAVRAMIARIYALVSTADDAEPQGNTLMERMVGNQRIPLDSELYQAGLRQFESNLLHLLEKYRRAEIPVFIGTVASNLRDHPPFISSDPPENRARRWSELTQQVQTLLSGPAPGDARAPVNEMISIDSTSAIAYFYRGRMHDRTGDSTRAVKDYIRAKELDQLRFRAPEVVNRIIESTASNGVQIVRTDSALGSLSSLGIPGHEVMTEHLHPNSEGFFLIADKFYDALYNSGLTDTDGEYIASEAARSQVLLTEVDSLVGMYRVQTLTANWPFRPIGAPAQPLDTLGSGTVGRLSLQLFERNISRLDALDQLRGHYLADGKPHEALKVVFSLIQRYPFWPNPYLSAASILTNLGQYEEAILYCEASNDRRESAEALRLLGSLSLKVERPREAIPVLERALVLEPGNAAGMYNLAGAYALTGNFDRAASLADRVLQQNPTHEGASRLRNSLPVQRSSATDN